MQVGLFRLSMQTMLNCHLEYTNLTKEVAKDVYLAKALTALQEAESVDSNNLQVLEARSKHFYMASERSLRRWH